MKNQPLIILGSASLRRIDLLKKLGLPFTVEKASIDESIKPKETAYQLVKRLSQEKARKVGQKYQDKDCLIIAADTVVALGKEIFSKPKDEDNAITILKKLSGRAHLVITGLTVLNPKTKKITTQTEKTQVFFRHLSDEEIINYVNSNEPFDKAGAYAIQEKGGSFVKKIKGDFFNVVGLPIFKLINMLKKFGLNLNQSTF